MADHAADPAPVGEGPAGRHVGGVVVAAGGMLDAHTASLWRMTFGYALPIEWDARIKGRGLVGIGEASSLIHHAQIACRPAQD